MERPRLLRPTLEAMQGHSHHVLLTGTKVTESSPLGSAS